MSVNNNNKELLLKSSLVHNFLLFISELSAKPKLRKRLKKINVTMVRIETKNDYL